MKLDGKQIVRMAATLLLLPVLYVASSGPVIRYASAAARSGDMAGKELYPSTTAYTRDPIESFYEPIFWSANATHLEKPLFAYLHVWNVYPMRAFGHVFVLVVHEQKQ